MTEAQQKFISDDEIYFKYLTQIKEDSPSIEDLIFQFPVFVGSVNLARLIMLYEVYNRTKELSGDILDIGTWKGFSFFAFAKFVKLFEPYSNTRVHCMDWFQGMNDTTEKLIARTGSSNNYDQISEENIRQLLRMQGLDGYAEVNNINLLTDLEDWCEKRPWHRFKLIFLDCGLEDVMEKVFVNLWDRLITGGIFMFDHFNSNASPKESYLINKYCPDRVVHQMSFSRSPTGYIIK